MANRREQLTGELPAAGSGGEGKAGPGAAPGAAVPREGARCWQSSAAPCAVRGERGGAGLGHGIRTRVLWEGLLPRTVALSLRPMSYALRRNIAFTLKIQSGAGWLQRFAFC